MHLLVGQHLSKLHNKLYIFRPFLTAFVTCGRAGVELSGLNKQAHVFWPKDSGVNRGCVAHQDAVCTSFGYEQ